MVKWTRDVLVISTVSDSGLKSMSKLSYAYADNSFLAVFRMADSACFERLFVDLVTVFAETDTPIRERKSMTDSGVLQQCRKTPTAVWNRLHR